MVGYSRKLTMAICALALFTAFSTSVYSAMAPISESALDAEVKLSSLKWDNGVLTVVVEVVSPADATKPAVLPSDIAVTVDGKQLPGRRDLMPTLARKAQLSMSFAVAHTRNVTVKAAVYAVRSDKLASFKFENVTAAALPTTRKSGQGTIVLKRVIANEPIGRNDWDIDFAAMKDLTPTTPVYGLVVEKNLPAGYVARVPDVLTVGDTHIDMLGSFADKATAKKTQDAIEAVRKKEQSYYTPEETKVRQETPEESEGMQFERTQRAVEQAADDIRKGPAVGTYLIAFPAQVPPPDRFAFETSGAFAPEPKDVVWVTFDNMRPGERAIVK
jgi:hypothetical protein